MCNTCTTLEGDSSSQLSMLRSSRRRPLSEQSSNDVPNSVGPTSAKGDLPKEHNSALQRWARQQRSVFCCLLLCGVTFVFVSNGSNHHHNHKKPPPFQAHFRSVHKEPPKRISDFHQSKPRVVGYMDEKIEETLQSKYHKVMRIQLNAYGGDSHSAQGDPAVWTWSNTEVDSMSEVEQPGGIVTNFSDNNSEEDDGDCQLPHKWMKQSFPTCNNLHEQGMMDQLVLQSRVRPQFLMGQGSMRSVWLLEQNYGQSTVLKTLRLERDFDDDNLDRHRRDALISERLTQSPHFLNVYGYCGQSAVYEYAASGSLYDVIGAREYQDEPNDPVAHAQWEQWSHERKLEVAYQVVSAVADLHDIDQDGIPSVAHDDLDITQFVSQDGGKTFQLSDFNGAPFIKFDPQREETCPFHALMKGGKTRSPQEYAGEDVTEKLDIFAMGNILYTIVTGDYPFRDLGSSDAKDRVLQGVLPTIPEEIEQDENPIVQALLNAMKLCWTYRPEKRASAAKVKAFLETYLHD